MKRSFLSVLGLAVLGGGLDRWGFVVAPGAGDDTLAAALERGADSIPDAGAEGGEVDPAAAGSGDGGGAGDPGAVADSGAVEGAKTEGGATVAEPGPMEKARAEYEQKLKAIEAERDTLRQEATARQEAAQKQADAKQVEKELLTALGPDLDALEAKVLSGELTEDQAAAEGERLATAWLDNRAKTDELAKARAELAELRAEKENAGKVAAAQKLMAESPEFKVGGEAAQKMVLDGILRGGDPVAEVERVGALVGAIAGSAVLAQKERDAAAGSAGPNVRGGAPASKTGGPSRPLTLAEKLDRAAGYGGSL